MSNRFIKFVPSEEAAYLLENHPNAMSLLMLIAMRARVYPGHPDGLQPGDALIGDHKACGLSRQNYRTSLAKLVDLKYIEIIWNGKKFLKREKSTINLTIKGMLVRLCDSRIWDININDANHQSNQRLTNSQPTGNHEQERKRKKKNEEEIKEKNTKKEIALEKVKVREFVTLTQQELDVLTQLHGPELCNMMFDELNAYKGSSGKSYKSDYHTMAGRGWVLKKCLAEHNNPLKAQPQGQIVAKKRPVEVNRQLATQAAKQYKSPTCELHVNGKDVMFLPLIGQQGPQYLSFFHDDFADELKIKLDKFRFQGVT